MHRRQEYASACSSVAILIAMLILLQCTLQVRLREVDEETKRINLSLQPVASNSNAKDVSPLVDADKSELRTGKITSIHDYGFFAAIDAGEQTVDG
jgi:predicted RNA-binding protein with RPS1 domain